MNRLRYWLCRSQWVSWWVGVALLLATQVSAAGSAPTLSIGHVSGPAGSTRSVPFVFSSGDMALGGVQMEIAVPADLVVVAGSASGPGNGTAVVCATPNSGLLICLIFNDNAPLPADFSVTVDFSASAGAPVGARTLSPEVLLYATAAGKPVPAGPTSPGSFEILALGPAVFSSQPAPDSTIDFGIVVHGNSATRAVQVSNVAPPDFPALVFSACSITGSLAWVLLQPTQFPTQLPAGFSLDLSVQVNASAALPQALVGTLACVVNDGEASFEVGWPLSATSVPETVFADAFE